MVVILRDEPGRVVVGWRDAMNLTPPTRIMQVVKHVYEEVFDRWVFSKDETENYEGSHPICWADRWIQRRVLCFSCDMDDGTGWKQ